MAEEIIKTIETVTNVEGIEKVLDELRSLKDEVTVLRSIADKTELAKYHEKMRDRTKRTCRLRVLRDKSGEKRIVTGWADMVVNDIFQDVKGNTVAKQAVKIFLEGGEEVVGELLDVGRRYEFIEAEKVEATKKNSDGQETEWKVKVNGKEMLIDTRFIN